MTSSVSNEIKLDDATTSQPRPESLAGNNITRARLTSGTLRSYIDDLTVTGLISNPSIFGVATEDSSLERFASRGEEDFGDKLLSAMRFEFGGHIERTQ